MPSVPELEADALSRLAANTRHWRLKAGLTQAQLAELVGVQAQTIQVIEAATRRPGLQVVFGLAVALELDISDLWRRRRPKGRSAGRPRRG